jgi:hypothetical protein
MPPTASFVFAVGSDWTDQRQTLWKEATAAEKAGLKAPAENSSESDAAHLSDQPAPAIGQTL